MPRGWPECSRRPRIPASVNSQGSPLMSFAEQLTRLQVFLDADELHDEALDYVAAHGYLTALSSVPNPVLTVSGSTPSSPRTRITPMTPSGDQPPWWPSRLISPRQLASDEFELPCGVDLGDDPDDSDLRGWCIGFMERIPARSGLVRNAKMKSVKCQRRDHGRFGSVRRAARVLRHRSRRQPDGRHDRADPRKP